MSSCEYSPGDSAETAALASLLCLHAARVPARVDAADRTFVEKRMCARDRAARPRSGAIVVG
jgi:predicted RNA polymerase sigma factor